MNIEVLHQSIRNRSAKLVVLGLGYVGLPVACSFAKAGFQVVGIRRDAEKVAMINEGVSPIEGKEPGLPELLAEVVAARRFRASTDYAECRDAQVVLITVETPVDEVTKKPAYEALRDALEHLGANLSAGTLVIVESTVSPGTMDRMVKPTLEEVSGLKVNEDFLLAICPERVMPGKLLANIQHCSRVVGGMSRETVEVAIDLYRRIVLADLDAADCVTAELVKTVENAYRDVQIAFANEVALLCETVGANVWEVRELVNKSPGRLMHLPGTGVGGHCIPKDPWLLLAGAGNGFVPRLVPAARAVNDGMPIHVAELTKAALEDAGVDVRGAKVAVLGYAYLENSDDTRNSPSIRLVERLRDMGAEVVVHDPYVKDFAGDVMEVVGGVDCIVVAVGHDQYRNLSPVSLKAVMRTPLLVDGRNVFVRESIEAAGMLYRGVGLGANAR